MQFVNPLFLIGLVAIAIPVIIHLFNFKRFKRVYFTNVKFLQELKLESQKQSRLRHLIILFLRILAILCLVLAFAQPYIPLTDNQVKQQARKAISIYIDNSFSMEARNGNGTLLDEAKAKAREIASVYQSSDLFQILTNDFEGSQQRFITRDEFLGRVDEVKISSAVKDISAVVRRQSDLFSANRSKANTSYLISDFQASTTSVNDFPKNISFRTYLIPVASNVKNNLYIDSCWFESPVHQLNQGEKLKVRIKNISKDPFEKIPLKLTINNQQRAVASFNIKSKGETELEIPFTNHEKGWQFGKLEISDYPITFDDRFYFTYPVTSVIKTLAINGAAPNVYLNSLFAGDSIVQFTNSSENSLNYSTLDNYNFLILNQLPAITSGMSQALTQFIGKGGCLAVIPSREADIKSYNHFLSTVQSDLFQRWDTSKTKIASINLQHVVFRDVFESVPENSDLPVVFSHFRIAKTVHSSGESLLPLSDGSSFCNVYAYGKGFVYLFASPLDPKFTNFPRHTLFVPTLYRMALLSIYANKLFYTLGSDEPIPLPEAKTGSEPVFKIRSRQKSFEMIPELRKTGLQLSLMIHNGINEAGNYTVFDGNNDICGIAFNYDRRESNLECLDMDQLQNGIDKSGDKNIQVFKVKEKPLAEALLEMNQGIQLWKIFVFLALFFLAAEVVLLRIWKDK